MTVSNTTVLRGGLRIKATMAVNAILDEDTLSFNSNEALATQQSIKAYIDNSVVANRRPKVIAIATSTSAPPTEVSGDRYILDNSGAPHAEWDGASQGDVVDFNGTTWDATTPSEGWVAYSDTDNKDALCVDDGTLQWELRNVAIVNHNDLSNIDGGTSAEYYHMTSAQHTSIVGGSSDASSLHHHDGSYYTETEIDNFGFVDTSGTPANDQIAVFTDANTIEGNDNLKINSSGEVSVGAVNTSQDYPGNLSALTSMGIHYVGTSNGWDAVPAFLFERGRGSLGAVTPPLSGDILGEILFSGMWDNTNQIPGAKIKGIAAENFASDQGGTDIVFYTANIDAASVSEKWRMEANGSLLFQDVSAPGTTTNRMYSTSTGLYYDGVRLDIAPDNNVEDGTAGGQMAFWDGSSEYKHTEVAEIYWDDTNKRLHTGTTNTSLTNMGDVNIEGSMYIQGIGATQPYMVFSRGKGSVGSITPPVTSDLIGNIHFNAMFSNTGQIDAARIDVVAIEDVASNKAGADMVFYTRSAGTGGSTAERLRIEDDGALLFPDMTAPGTTTNRLYNTSTGLYFDGTRLDVAAGASQLSELSDVGVTTATAGRLLVADGDSWESVAVGGAITMASSGATAFIATAETSADDADLLLIYDDTATAYRRMTRANFLDGVGPTAAENTDVDTGTEDVDTFADTLAKGCTWSYIVTNGTNHRGGIVIASWNATTDTVTYTDMSTDDQGDTSQLTFSVDISTNTVRLRAAATSDNWNVQVERSLIAKA